MIACVILALLAAALGYLYLQARSQVDEIRAERDQQARDKGEVARELAALQREQQSADPCDPAELTSLREQLEQAREATRVAQEALNKPLEPDKSTVVANPVRPSDCSKLGPSTPRQCPVCANDDTCQAALQRERESRKACERELNSEIRDTLR